MNRPVKPPLRWLLIAVLVPACLLLARSDATPRIPEGLHFMPPYPDLGEKLNPEELSSLESTKLERGIDVPEYIPNPPTGEFNLLVVLVDFDDNQAIVAPDDFDSLFFNTFEDSVADYYDEISNGSLSLETVDLPGDLGWQRLPKSYNPSDCSLGDGYVNADCQTNTSDDFGWGAYPQNLQGIVSDTIPLIDDLVDFSQYDNNGDGFVDGVVFVHAGVGAEFSADEDPKDIWSSAWDMSSGNGPGPIMTGDGVLVDDFAFGPEYLISSGDITIGVFAHELGHLLFGLPDLYDLDENSWGIGNWSLMSYGAWLGAPSGSKPAWPDAWSRIRMGFESPQVVIENIAGQEFLPVEDSPGNVFKLWTPDLGDEEYFLVENRDQLGYDASLPGNGLLIWHVDESKWNRRELNLAKCDTSPCCACEDDHPLLALIQADGSLHLENKLNKGDPGDPFPIFDNNSFGFGTDPESGSYYANTCPKDSCIAVNNIADSGSGSISADLNVVCQAQGACVDILADRVLGWGDAGENVTYLATLQNCGSADDTLTLSYEGAWLAEFFDLESGEPITATEVPAGGSWEVGITVTVPAEALWSDTDVLSLTVNSANDAGVSATLGGTTAVPYCTLVVDDDRDSPHVEEAYTGALLGAGYDFDIWDTQTRGSPDEATLAAHKAVVWFTGTPSDDTLTPHDEAALTSYLQGGGDFFFSSQEYLTDTLRDYFGRQYLRVSTFVDDTGVQAVTGVPTNPLSDGMGPYTLNITTTLSDQVLPLSPILSAFTDENGITNAITYDPGAFRTLFIAWPFEHLAPADGEELMASTMNWMDVSPRPLVDFEMDPDTVCEGNPVNFTNTSSYASKYLWSFGDGITSTLTDTLHIYSTPMTATVTLTGTNSCGYAAVTEAITIYDTPRVEFTPTLEEVYVHQPISFTTLSTETLVLSYTWDFGDGSEPTGGTSPVHKFNQSGWYTVRLGTSDGRCTGITSMQLYVKPLMYLPLAIRKQDSSLMGQQDIWQGSARYALVALSAASLGLVLGHPFRRR